MAMAALPSVDWLWRKRTQADTYPQLRMKRSCWRRQKKEVRHYSGCLTCGLTQEPVGPVCLLMCIALKPRLVIGAPPFPVFTSPTRFPISLPLLCSLLELACFFPLLSFWMEVFFQCTQDFLVWDGMRNKVQLQQNWCGHSALWWASYLDGMWDVYTVNLIKRWWF